jgi:hypothetical protein
LGRKARPKKHTGWPVFFCFSRFLTFGYVFALSQVLEKQGLSVPAIITRA